MTLHQVAGVRLNVEELAPAVDDRSPLVLLHGFTGSVESWRSFADSFGACVRPIAVDLLGHGGSDKPSDPALYRPEAQVAQLLGLFDRLGLDRVNLLGYSMGGRLALQLAVVAPERLGCLVLESASPGIADAAERAARVRADDALASFAEREGIAAFVDRWERVPLFASQARLPAAVRARLREQRLTNDPTGIAGSLRGFGAGVPEPLWDLLPTLDVPTLVVVGALDSKYRQVGRDMTERMPRGELAIVPDAGHNVHLEQPCAFARLVLHFLGG
ncbi:MAG TPA: 2-succinyl-6-hydroxy-2,4-cyclohexadiene-1-carboxylate synthase [Chloroflexota bacterium]|nr:2-succinyl-6-hydroxy-2,4-cyclohexadiene-1-carboxylate synthase [Chloroflexota bacterium]